jgi:hypothetical protein
LSSLIESVFPFLPAREIREHEALEDPAMIRCEQVNEFMDDDELAQVLREPE